MDKFESTVKGQPMLAISEHKPKVLINLRLTTHVSKLQTVWTDKNPSEKIKYLSILKDMYQN